MSGDATIVLVSGALTIANGAVNNAKVASGAAIAANKLAALTAHRAIASDSSGFLTPSATTDTRHCGCDFRRYKLDTRADQLNLDGYYTFGLNA